MNYNNEGNMWDWQGHEYLFEDTTGTDVPKSLLHEVNQNVDHMSYMFDDGVTPVKDCGDLAYHVANNEVTGKELQEYREHSSQVKRRRMLQFDSEVFDAALCNDEAFLRSKETQDSFEDAIISDTSEWDAGFTDGTSAYGNDLLDTSYERWIADCLNDTEMHFCNENISASGASNVQTDVGELCNTHPEYDTNTVKKAPVHTHQNVVFKGRKSYMRPPPKLASSVVYPFAFIKPCGGLGDMTLKDINQRIRNPPKSKQTEEDPSVSYPTSAFSGKPVVGKTKIRTEGGKGSITIMRTKG